MDLSTLFERFLTHLANTPPAAWACSIGVVVLSVVVWVSAWNRGAPHVLALVVATLYCLVSEYLAIQLGKYHYAAFPLSIPEISCPPLQSLLNWLGSLKIIPAPLPDVPGVSKHVPVEVALLEGMLLYGVFRLTNLLSPQPPPCAWRLCTIVPRVRDRWANPVLNGFLALSLDAMLDPIVSGTMSLDRPELTVPGLALWTWHTNSHYSGHWFGVPLANYNAWFAALFAFTAATRLDDKSLFVGDEKVVACCGIVIWAIVKALGLLTGSLFVVKFALDYVTYEFGYFGLGRPTPPAWQFTVIGVLVALGLIGAVRIARRAQRAHAFELGTVIPIAFVFAYCGAALVFGGVLQRDPRLAVLWLVSAIVAAVHASSPWLRKRVTAPAVVT